MRNIVFAPKLETTKNALAECVERYDGKPINDETASMALAEYHLMQDKCKNVGKYTEEDEQVLQLLMNVYNVCTTYKEEPVHETLPVQETQRSVDGRI